MPNSSGGGSVALFKSGSEILALGHDCVLRRDFNGAYEKYVSATKKFAKDGNRPEQSVAEAYAAVMAISQGQSNPDILRSAVRSLQALGNLPLKMGLREVSSTELSQEMDLLASEIEIRRLNPANASEYADKARRLQDLASKFRTYTSGRILVIPELFERQTVRGELKALPLSALAEEALGESLISSDPKTAAEHYQTARLWWSQAGQYDETERAAGIVGRYAHATKCWFCGRQVTGEGIHFRSMPSDLTELLKKIADEDALPSYNGSKDTIFACMGCYSAIEKLADSLAVMRMKELEAKINVQLTQLANQISNIDSRMRSRGI